MFLKKSQTLTKSKMNDAEASVRGKYLRCALKRGASYRVTECLDGAGCSEKNTLFFAGVF